MNSDTGTTVPTIDLTTPYPLTQQQVDLFHDQGFIKLKNVLSPDTLAYYGQEITRQVIRLNQQTKPMEQRTTYERAFLQIMNLWRQSQIVREFTFSPRLARLAAQLMGVRGVRLYHDQALYKESGGGITPWHVDQQYWPLSNNNTCTVWVPLQATPMEMGPLAFAAGSQRFQSGRNLEISDESERQLQRALAEQRFPLEESAFELGEVSYHWGWTFHRAGPNTSDQPRAVMTIIYMDEQMRLTEPRNQNQMNDWNNWLPGIQPGQPAATHLNPVLHHIKG